MGLIFRKSIKIGKKSSTPSYLSTLPKRGLGSIILGGIFLIAGFFNPLFLLLTFISGFIGFKKINTVENRANSIVNKAIISYKRGRKDESLRLLEKSLLLNENNPKVLFLKGVILCETGEYEKGVTLLEDGPLELRDDYINYLLAKAHYYTASPEKSVDILQEIITNCPNNIDVINLLAMSFIRLRYYERAVKILKNETIIRKNFEEELLETRYLLGTALLKLGDRKGALKNFIKIYSVDINYRDVQAIIKELGGCLPSII